MRKILQKRTNLIYELVGPSPQVLDLPAGYSWTRIDRAALDRFITHAGDPRRSARYTDYLEAGCVGFLVFADQEWAAAAWLAPASVMTQPSHLPPSIRGSAPWLFEDHTRATHRGRGLHRFLIAKRVQYATTHYDPVSCVAATDINPGNLPSRRSYLSSGFSPAGRYTALTLSIPLTSTTFVTGWHQRRYTHPYNPQVQDE